MRLTHYIQNSFPDLRQRVYVILVLAVAVTFVLLAPHSDFSVFTIHSIIFPV